LINEKDYKYLAIEPAKLRPESFCSVFAMGRI
jgi:hypothetical protein